MHLQQQRRSPPRQQLQDLVQQSPQVVMQMPTNSGGVGDQQVLSIDVFVGVGCPVDMLQAGMHIGTGPTVGNHLT